MEMFNKYIIHASYRNDINLQQSYMIGQLLLENSDNIKSAVEHFYKMSINYPNIFEITYGLSLAYIKIGKPELAIKILEDWILLHPNHKEAIEWMSLIKNQT